MNFKNIISFVIILFFSSELMSQIMIAPLSSNPVLVNYAKSHPGLLNRSTQALDTITLPFFDDFSKYNFYPNTSFWLDNDVFINQTYGDNPPSIGVATFDALDATGVIHSEIGPHSVFLSDYLTSKPIDLINHSDTNPINIQTSELFYYETATGTYYNADSLWYDNIGIPVNCMTNPTTYHAGMGIYYREVNFLNDVSDSLYTYNSISGLYEYIDIIIDQYYSVSDSLYFSFYYQPQGLAYVEPPESTDSLVLEFKNKSGNWIHVWSMAGFDNAPFKKVLIPLRDTSYVYKGFQFRFYNYVSIGDLLQGEEGRLSNNDIWNIDYISLSPNRNMYDTISDDVTFVNNIQTCIKNYVSVPWDHYKSSPNQIDTLRFLYRNLSDTIKNVQRRNIITNKTNNNIILNRSLGSENIAAFSDSIFKRKETEIYFPTNSDNSAVFEVQLTVKSGNSSTNAPFYWNDTIKFYQRFSNYYAYDDGTSEYGAGLAGSGTYGSKFAYKFCPIKPDTLRGAYMYFNRSLNDANKDYFYLAVWKWTNGKPGDLIYKQEPVRPQLDELNNFHYYLLDTSIFIQDTFFIGWIQTTTDFINIGVDINNDASNKEFYNINGTWKNWPFPGSIMIRPIFTTEPFVNVPQVKVINQIKVYPNPATDIIYIDAPENFNGQLFNITGLSVKELIAGNKEINISDLPSGLYFLRGTDGKSMYTSKIVINR